MDSVSSRIAYLRGMHLEEALGEDFLTALRDFVVRVADAFEVKAAHIAILGEARPHVLAASDAEDVSLGEDRLRQRAANPAQVRILPDTAGFAGFEAGDTGFYAAAPLRAGGAIPFGTLALTDPAPRPDWRPKDTALLETFARLLGELFQQRGQAQDVLNERAMLANGPTGAVIWKAERGLPLVYASDNLGRVIGTEQLQALKEGGSFERIIHPDDQEDFRLAMHGHIEASLLNIDLTFRVPTQHGMRWIRQTSQTPALAHTSERLIFAYLLDETHQKRLEQANALVRERLSMAVEAANIGVFDLNLATDERIIDDRTAATLGFRAVEIDTHVDTWLSMIHPFDRPRVERKIRGVVPAPDFVKLEYRMRHKDRHFVWMQSFGKVVERFADGAPLRIVGTMIDISEHKRDELQRTKQRQLLEVLNSAQASFMFSHDIQAACNGLFEPLLRVAESQFGFIGVMRHTAEGNPYLLIPAISDLSWSAEARAAHGEKMKKGGLEFHKLDNLFGHVVTRNEVVLTNRPALHGAARGTPAGHPHLDNFLGLPIRFGGKVVGMIGLANATEGYQQDLVDLLEPLVTTLGALIHALDMDVERQKMQRELEARATTDDLTGLHNRRQFEALARRELALARRRGHVLTLALIDLDHFKRVNDTYGHAAGDAVLKHFALLAHTVLRESDIIGRMGGEEFAVLMTHTSLEEARGPLERLRLTLAETTTPFGEAAISITASAGLVQSEGGEGELDALMRAADGMLYRAKSSGRNRIEPPPPETARTDAVVIPLVKVDPVKAVRAPA
ncbi:hypothetical protein GCM10007301_39490 [Azorhizobium oxalatiphilum]|uniref:diguanylate cyclase n=1 Tax=Azorhizobium oxalatiphilum TaxID=980631 RepID=A0A917C7D0_9HYPH|nr:diguanylate cyclase [Azorhizobium oxalatiphilum]GGF75670.1 hypothetical protein GCM10007301_39490 [Azorhizobium oxalatiphilum]